VRAAAPRPAALAALLLVPLAAPLAAQAPTQTQAAAPAAAGAAAARAAGTVRGRVTSPDGRPLADVMVVLTPEGGAAAGPAARLGALTDAAGRYAVAGVPAGRHAVTARRVGLGEQTVAVVVDGGGAATADFRLAERAAVIAPVVVSATRERQRRAEASATIDVLDGADVRLARAAHPAQVLKRVPGVYVSQLSGEGHAMAIRQPITTRPMYLYLEDGVPTRATGFFNHNALYEVNLPQSGGVEVLKGPGTALYGSDAIGGVVNVLTRPAPATPGVEAATEGGGYGYQRLLATGGGMWGRSGVRADLNLTRMRGWRERSAYDRQSATVRWDHTGDDGFSVRTVVTGTLVDQQDLLAQDSAQFRARDPLNRSPLAYRDVTALRASTAVARERQGSAWSLTPYARYNVLKLVPNWQLTFDPQRWDTRNTSLGLLARARRDVGGRLPDGRPALRLVGGADLDLSPGSHRADSLRVFCTNAGTATCARATVATRFDSAAATRAVYDYDVTYRQASPYVQAEFSPLGARLPGLRVDAGARYDWMRYDYRTRLAPTQAGRWRVPGDAARDYARLSPKLGATYEASPALALYGSYRAGFRAPSQGQLFQQGTALNTVDLRPVSAASAEVGARGQLGRGLLYQLAGYDMTIRDDILTFTRPDGLREARNAGTTRHRGVELSVSAMVRPTVRVDVAGSLAANRYVTYTPAEARPATPAQGATPAAPAAPAVSYAGRDIEQAPSRLANALVTWSPRLLRGGRVAAEYSAAGRYVAGYQLDAFGRPDRAVTYGGYGVWTLHANAQLTTRAELFGRVVNVADRTYAEVAGYNHNDRVQRWSYTPGNPRTVFLGVRLAAQR
jgi:outer membrane receptor protein involved in Fe transport